MKLKYLLIGLISLSAIACKKNKVEPTPDPTPIPSTGTRAELSKDSLFLYAKEIYFWNENLPTYQVFNPRQYTSLSTDALNYNKVLFEITKYSKPFEYKDGATRPKFSYIFDKTDKNPVAYINTTASVDLEGNGNDIGLRLVPYLTNATSRSYYLFITAVYQGSPADKAGLKRGMLVQKINGQSFGTNFENESDALNTALAAATVNVEGKNFNDQVPFSASLVKTSYKSSPIYTSKIFDAGTKKIGYFAMARFSKLTVSTTDNESDVNLDPIFVNFADKGVTDLIIDLRYNGGGYVATSGYLMNLISPTSNNGKVMYKEYFNTLMQNKQATILKNQPLLDDNDKLQDQNRDGKFDTYFDVNYTIGYNTNYFKKKGNLNTVQNIVFLVTENTASASELLINSLKPYFNVKVIGSTTYGKPIGFFPITLENKYEVYFSLFETKNSLDQGGYYDGIAPELGYDEDKDPTKAFWDDVRFNFGDPKEAYLAGALKILSPGTTFTNSLTTTTMSFEGRKVEINKLSEMKPVKGQEFVGMVENRFSVGK